MNRTMKSATQRNAARAGARNDAQRFVVGIIISLNRNDAASFAGSLLRSAADFFMIKYLSGGTRNEWLVFRTNNSNSLYHLFGNGFVIEQRWFPGSHFFHTNN